MKGMEYHFSHGVQTQHHVKDELVQQVIFEDRFHSTTRGIRKLELQRPEAGYQGYLMPKKLNHPVAAQFEFLLRFRPFPTLFHEADQSRREIESTLLRFPPRSCICAMRGARFVKFVWKK